MNKVLVAILIVFVLAGGYWYGEHRHKAGDLDGRQGPLFDGSSDSPIVINVPA